MLREAVVLLRSLTVQPRVPLISTVEGVVGSIEHTMILLEVGSPTVSKEWRNDIEADRL